MSFQFSRQYLKQFRNGNQFNQGRFLYFFRYLKIFQTQMYRKLHTMRAAAGAERFPSDSATPTTCFVCITGSGFFSTIRTGKSFLRPHYAKLQLTYARDLMVLLDLLHHFSHEAYCSYSQRMTSYLKTVNVFPR